jgi:hypothetical protein
MAISTWIQPIESPARFRSALVPYEYNSAAYSRGVSLGRLTSALNTGCLWELVLAYYNERSVCQRFSFLHFRNMQWIYTI